MPINQSELIQRAISVLKNSYVPYLKFNVAAAVLCSSEKIYTGVNIENASYPEFARNVPQFLKQFPKAKIKFRQQ